MDMLPPNLCYTIALDDPGQDVYRRMARLLVTSLLKTGWHGRIAVFTSGQKPVLPEGHPMVQEIPLDTVPSRVFAETTVWKYQVRDLLKLEGIGKVLFLDCDIIALRSINHLMFGSWDIYTSPEPGRMTEHPFNGYLTDTEMGALSDRPGLNAGVIGIRQSAFAEVMAEWQRIDQSAPLRPSKCRDQHAWNRLILDTPLRHRHIAEREIQFPFLHRANYLDYRHAALIHAADRSPEEKFSLLFELWMGAFGRGEMERVTRP